MKENVSGCFFLNTVYNALLQYKNLFNKVASFRLRFINKSVLDSCNLFVNKKLDKVKQYYMFDFPKSYLKY